MYNQRKKPQKIAWTQAWRRLHKKNVDNRQKKKVSEQLGQYYIMSRTYFNATRIVLDMISCSIFGKTIYKKFSVYV